MSIVPYNTRHRGDVPDLLTPFEIFFFIEKTYRHSHLEIDVNQKSERMEWGHVKYHTVMQPGFAFEIVVQWVTSSGPIVWDLVSCYIIYKPQHLVRQCQNIYYRLMVGYAKQINVIINWFQFLPILWLNHLPRNPIHLEGRFLYHWPHTF